MPPSFDYSRMDPDLFNFSSAIGVGAFRATAYDYINWLQTVPPRTPEEENALTTFKTLLDDDNVFPHFGNVVRRDSHWYFETQVTIFDIPFDTPLGWLVRKLFHRMPQHPRPYGNRTYTYYEQLTLLYHRAEMQWREARNNPKTSHTRKLDARLKFETLYREITKADKKIRDAEAAEKAEKKAKEGGKGDDLMEGDGAGEEIDGRGSNGEAKKVEPELPYDWSTF